jgi:hypothetical protein
VQVKARAGCRGWATEAGAWKRIDVTGLLKSVVEKARGKIRRLLRYLILCEDEEQPETVQLDWAIGMDDRMEA